MTLEDPFLLDARTRGGSPKQRDRPLSKRLLVPPPPLRGPPPPLRGRGYARPGLRCTCHRVPRRLPQRDHHSPKGPRHAHIAHSRSGLRRHAGRRSDRDHHRPADARPRRLLRRARPALRPSPDGRPVHSPRPGGTRRHPAHRGFRRAAASAYRPRHRHLHPHRRDRAPRFDRQPADDHARRRELDDRRARHRPFRARARRHAQHRPPDRRVPDLGGAAENAGGSAAELRPSRQGRAAADIRRGGERAACGRLALRRASPGRHLHRHVLRRRHPVAGRPAAGRRRRTRSAPPSWSRAASRSAARSTRPDVSSSSVPARRRYWSPAATPR